QIPMFEHPLEERCYQFAKRVRAFTRKLKRDTENFEDIKQVTRSSGSVGANYIEANENVGPGDLRYRIKVSRKEAKESMHFLGLIEVFGNKELEVERNWLVDEAGQLRKIFSAMLKKLDDSRSKDK
ncbi:MAG TPA: four helix bundle protein, partial [Chitinophagaceae bacterium]|nr:four helix bundle protein [Chitinophagaceae bacterium]